MNDAHNSDVSSKPNTVSLEILSFYLKLVMHDMLILFETDNK